MVDATVYFLPGWVHRAYKDEEKEDPATGERYRSRTPTLTEGTGLVQAPQWTGFSEFSSTAIKDERLVMFQPTDTTAKLEISADDEFISPEGHVWQTTTDGMPRSIPGQPPAYYAARVRRAKEKEQ